MWLHGQIFMWSVCMLVCGYHLYKVICIFFYWFFVFVWCLFDSGWNISFEQMHIQSMTLVSSTLQIRRHEYFKDFNIVIFKDIDTLSFYAINMDIVILFAKSPFLFLANLNLYCINILYQFEWINIFYFKNKIKSKWHG